MKKIIVIVIAILSLILLSTFEPTKYYNEEITVIFFTSNIGSNQVESYFDVTPNSIIDEPTDPNRLGYTFDGWYKTFEASEEWDFEVDTVVENSIVLYAKWIPTLLYIIYDINEGEMINPVYNETFFAGEAVILPLPRRTGFSFVAWYDYDWIDESSTIPGDRGYQSLPTDIYEDIYLYAHWEAVSVQVSLKANYPIDDEGPSNPSSVIVDYGTIIDFPTLDDTAEYEFIGWNNTSDGTGDFYTNGDVFVRTQRTILFAIWQLIE